MGVKNLLQAVNAERLQQEFCRLVEVDSVSFQERKMADVLKKKLQILGAEVYEDEAAEILHSEAGNVYGYLPGELPGEPLLFSAHMDTVEPGKGKKAVCHEDGRITSEGNTVLGADDMAGASAIFEAIRVLEENHIPHRSVELLFPVAEEAYVRGSSVFDYGRIKAKEAYVLDLSGPVGRASLQEPTLISFAVRVRGRAAHAGFAPEEGIHAIAAASRAIAAIAQGRIGEDTTVNIGKIEGGKATNIVPELVTVEGEIRSYDHEKAQEQLFKIRRVFETAAKETGAQIEVQYETYLTAYQLSEEEPVVKNFREVCEQLSIECQLTSTFGGSDNNSFLKHGIRGIVLACGMNQVHTASEYSSVDELVKCAAIVAGLLSRT